MSTDAYLNFSLNQKRINLFIKFSEALDLDAEEIKQLKTELYWETHEDEVEQIQQQIASEYPSESSTTQMKLVMESVRQSESKLLKDLVRQFRRSRDELLIIQLVAAADSYRNELTELLLRNKTDGLRKNKDAIIRILIDNPTASDWDSVYDDIIRSGVNSFIRSSKGYKGWIEKIKKEFSVSMDLPNEHKEISHWEEVIATRNLLAHAGNIINANYLGRSAAYYKETAQAQPQVGEERVINHTYCVEAIDCLDRIFKAVDDAAGTII